MEDKSNGHFVSLDHGVIHMYNECIDAVGKDCGKPISPVLIEAVISGRSIGDEEVEQTVKDTADQYAKKLVASLKDIGVDFDLSLPVFVGGGSLVLKEPLIKAINRKNSEDIMFLDNIRANAIGYETFANRYAQEKGLAKKNG